MTDHPDQEIGPLVPPSHNCPVERSLFEHRLVRPGDLEGSGQGQGDAAELLVDTKAPQQNAKDTWEAGAEVGRHFLVEKN